MATVHLAEARTPRTCGGRAQQGAHGARSVTRARELGSEVSCGGVGTNILRAFVKHRSVIAVAT